VVNETQHLISYKILSLEIPQSLSNMNGKLFPRYYRPEQGSGIKIERNLQYFKELQTSPF
jgi:hypothetical protein